MKKIRILTEISAFVLVGTATEKIVLPNVKKQIGVITKYETTNPFYKTKTKVIVDHEKKEPPVQKYFFKFYRSLTKPKPFVRLKNSKTSFRSFIFSKEKGIEKNVEGNQKVMGYSTGDRDPEFFGGVIGIEKPGQYKSFVGGLKRLKLGKN